MKIIIRVVVVAFLVAAGYVMFQRYQSLKLNTQAVNLINEGEYEEAVNLLEEARSLSPKNTIIQQNLAIAYEGIEEKKTANDIRARIEKRLERMRKDGWKDDSATIKETLDVAEASFQIGNYEQAIILYERALFKNPTNTSLELKIEALEEKVRKGII